MSKPKMFELHADKLDAQTEKAFGVVDSKGVMRWFPKSVCRIEHRTNRVVLFVPEYIATNAYNNNFEFE